MAIECSEIYKKFDELDNASKAQIKRATELDDIKQSIILFRLGLEFNKQCCRIALLLPFLKNVKNEDTFGVAIAKLDNGDIGIKKDKYTTIGKRLMRIIRLEPDNDLYEFRRLLRFVASKSSDKAISVNSKSACESLYYWGEKSKKQVFEDYLLKQYSYKSKEED